MSSETTDGVQSVRERAALDVATLVGCNPRTAERALERVQTLARKGAALEVAALVGCDPRTVERALEFGVDAIRPRRLRETLRVELARLHAESNATTTNERR